MQHVVIKKIGINEIQLIEAFLENAGSSLTSFRYFEKRPLVTIANHLVTSILLENGKPVGYGHLDKEKENVWLGIAVSEEAKGKGYGNRLMDFLVTEAKEKTISTILLTVDKNNLAAISLYEKFGFISVKDINERSLLMELNN